MCAQSADQAWPSAGRGEHPLFMALACLPSSPHIASEQALLLQLRRTIRGLDGLI